MAKKQSALTAWLQRLYLGVCHERRSHSRCAQAHLLSPKAREAFSTKALCQPSGTKGKGLRDTQLYQKGKELRHTHNCSKGKGLRHTSLPHAN
mmetsp:Transcript_12528/g.34210  ORF Transcript_12528/g.34210 Transcript_12528/m.34210 type:complete len:93 (+) Transcript_12528:804-1082(+)